MCSTKLNARMQPSKKSSPVFDWSPLPPRRYLSLVKREDEESSAAENLYPNCDSSVWLRSCEKEITTPLKGQLTGTIPKWLTGSLLRNGPGSLKVGKEEFSHLFDSSALLHRFRIENGEVTYQCRFLDSESFRKNWAANRIVMTEFGTRSVEDPCHSIFKRIAAIFTSEISDNANISLYPFGDQIYAFTEMPTIHQVNLETLETEGRVKVNDYVSIVSHTSHPHVDKNGTVYNLGLSACITGLYYNIVQFPSKDHGNVKEMFEKAEIVASIPVRWIFNPSYMHSFGITENFYLVVEQPLTISMPNMMACKLNSSPIVSCFRWFHEEHTRISVISRATGKLFRSFYSKSFFYLHIINQYEFDDHIVIDICIYNDPYMLDCMYTEAVKSMQQNPDYAKMFRGRPARFILPLNPEQKSDNQDNLIRIKNTQSKANYLPNGDILVFPERLCNYGCETPRINYDYYLGKIYRYFYAISSDVDAENPGQLIKVDVLNKTVKTWGERNCYPSEPIFVPRPESTKEDDGVILAAMIWGGEDLNHVGLLVLDAETFTELGRAEFTTPSPVPKCLHGWFVSR